MLEKAEGEIRNGHSRDRQQWAQDTQKTQHKQLKRWAPPEDGGETRSSFHLVFIHPSTHILVIY